MRIPVPANRLVALTLVGALLTTIVAIGLAVPDLGLAGTPASLSGGDAGTDAAADAPTPNPDFTPAVATSSTGVDEEHEHEDDEHDEEAEDEEHEREDE